MKKTLTGIVAAAALAASTAIVPTPASANPAWLVPALIGVGLGGFIIGGATAANANGPVLVDERPPYPADPDCYIDRVRGPDGHWHRVQICPLN